MSYRPLHLTLRWSERRTAARSALKMTSIFPLAWKSDPIRRRSFCSRRPLARRLVEIIFFGVFASIAQAADDDPSTNALLKLFKEEPLAKFKDVTKDKPLEIYRVIVSRSFHAPLMFTLEMEEDGGWLRVQKARLEEISVGFEPTKVLRNSRFKMTRAEVENVRKLIEDAAFWKLPSEDWRSPGLDGSGWRVEGAKQGRYHFTERASPLGVPHSSEATLSAERMHQEGCLTAVCLYIWAWAGETNEPIY